MKENILSYPFTIFHVQEQRPLIGMHESHVRFGWITSETLTLNESETYQSYSYVWVLNIFHMFAYAVDMLHMFAYVTTESFCRTIFLALG